MSDRGLPPEDNGHTVVSMRMLDPSTREVAGNAASGSDSAPLSRQETRWALFASLRAAFLLAAVFSLAIVAFVVFLLFIWR